MLLHARLLHRNFLLPLEISARHDCTKDYRQALKDRGSITHNPSEIAFSDTRGHTYTF